MGKRASGWGEIFCLFEVNFFWDTYLLITDYMKGHSLRDVCCLLRIITRSLVMSNVLYLFYYEHVGRKVTSIFTYVQTLYSFSSELFKDTKIKKRREKIPVDSTGEFSDTKNASVEEVALAQLPSKEETKMTSKNVERSGASLKTHALEVPQKETALQARQKAVEPEREKKRVKIEDEDHDASTLCRPSESNSLTSAAPRSVSASVYGQGNQHRPASLFFRCMNCAIHFFIYFLSLACNVIPQLRLPTLNLSEALRKTKMMTNERLLKP